MSDLPPGWEWTTLGEIASSVKNGIFVSRPGSDPNGVPILRISSVRSMQLSLDDIRYSEQGADELQEQDALLIPGDLLFTRYSGSREYVGVCARVPNDVGPLTYPDKLIRVRVPIIEPSYLTAAFASPTVRASVQSVLRTTAGQVGISGSALKSIRIPVAPLGEQRRIAAALDEHLSRLDAGSGHLMHCTGQLPSLRAAALAEVHDVALSKAASSRTIGEIAVTQLGKMLDAKRTEGVSTEYLRNINVRWQSVDLAALQQVPLTKAERAKFSLEPGDILVCEGGEPGRCAVWRGQRPHIAFQKALHRIRVRGNVMPEWVSLMLEHAVRSGRVKRLLTGSTIKHLPQEKLRSVSIPVPERDIQQLLVEQLDRTEGTRVRLEETLSIAATRSDALRRSLLTEAFTGRLVRQDPNDEPASVLLERIRAERVAKSKPTRARRTRQSDNAQETLL
jgi:type I restriction enzyme S subunit